MEYTLKDIGLACKIFRIKEMCMTQTEVASETGYSRSLISLYEMGRTNNALLLTYYINAGMNLNEYLRRKQ